MYLARKAMGRGTCTNRVDNDDYDHMYEAKVWRIWETPVLQINGIFAGHNVDMMEIVFIVGETAVYMILSATSENSYSTAHQPKDPSLPKSTTK